MGVYKNYKSYRMKDENLAGSRCRYGKRERLVASNSDDRNRPGWI